MDLAERAGLILDFARVLYVNGQATDRIIAAVDSLGRTLGVEAKLIARWGELTLHAWDATGSMTVQRWAQHERHPASHRQSWLRLSAA